MRLLSIIASFFLLFGCNSDNAPECLRSAGDPETQIKSMDAFDQLLIDDEFNIILNAGSSQEVKVTAPENLIDEIEFNINDGQLSIINTIGCIWTRPYDFPTIEITSPNLTSIELTGGSLVTSTGILNYDRLNFKSIDSNSSVDININCQRLVVNSNEITNYSLRGTTEELKIQISSGDGRVDASELKSKTASVTHNGTNDIIVSTTQSLSGSLNSTGDVIFVDQVPSVIDVIETNRGRLINGLN